MKLKDRLFIKHGINIIFEMVYMGSTQTQHLFSKPEHLVGPEEKAVLWCGEVGATSFTPIKKKHAFKQLKESEWELDVEPIEEGDL